MPKCRTCQVEKPQSDFYRNKSYSSGYNSQCKTCQTAYYQERNKDPEVLARHNARTKAWSAKNRDKVLEIKAKYRANNREALLEYGREWAKANRGKKNANWQRYRARKFQATPKNDPAIDYVYYSADLIKEIYGGRPDVDHRVPLKNELVSGLHVAHNLQLLNPSANYSKGAKWRN